ncbi:MAG TPA: GIY-YIG nuclease family protein [Roseiflexaceae bacterium]|nr:GIY-YIG nuclease family protein [Roseiflexaceae bacterium]
MYLAVGNRGTRYVGQTRTTMMKRWRKHISDLRRNAHHNTPLQNAVNSGEGFFIIPLEYIPRDSGQGLFDERERHWMKWAGSAIVNVAA